MRSVYKGASGSYVSWLLRLQVPVISGSPLCPESSSSEGCLVLLCPILPRRLGEAGEEDAGEEIVGMTALLHLALGVA